MPHRQTLISPQNTPQNAATPAFFEFSAFTPPPPHFSENQLITATYGKGGAKKIVFSLANFVCAPTKLACVPTKFAGAPTNFVRTPVNLVCAPAKFTCTPTKFAGTPANFVCTPADFACVPAFFVQRNKPLIIKHYIYDNPKEKPNG
ncbi:MAG: hypothetical protein LBI45_05855 [Bacteroidales bacterium]|jgi:hypothetical protein|nr:hypothetical protein [Bacteroidales bacterium]